jgi:hypothetical protein
MVHTSMVLPKSGSIIKIQQEFKASNYPYFLECNAHLFWPNYVAKIMVCITFDGKLEKHR